MRVPIQKVDELRLDFSTTGMPSSGRIAGGATCQPYTIGITSEGPVCPASCAALDACHVAGVCASTGLCTNPDQINGAPCNDGNACTQVDTCQAGACTGASPVVCVAADPCTPAGLCDPGTGSCSLLLCQ